MAIKLFRVLCVVPVCLLSLACEDTFQPKGPFEDRLVVYCVLTTRSDTVIARVHKTYDIPGFDPFVQKEDVAVSDAIVALNTQGSVFLFRDTVLIREDKTRYKTDIPAYVLQPFRVRFGETYVLTVQSAQYGTISAFTTVPDHGSLSLVNAYVLDNPDQFRDQHVIVSATLSGVARGYMIRALIEYEAFVNHAWKIHSMEVPVRYRRVLPGFLGEPVYPQLRRRTGRESGTAQEVAQFPVVAFEQVASNIRASYGSANVRFRRAVFVLTQVEAALYNYYNIVNGFRDEFSMRLDEPDYTNISNGVGVFGAFSEDSTFYALTAPVWR